MAAIIFDFDGTIADSFDFVVDLLAREAGRAPLSDEEKLELRGQSMAAIGRQLGLSWPKLLRLFFKGRRQMQDAIKHVQPFDDIPEVIKKLHAEGHELFIVSSNTVQNIHAFLHHHELHTYFLEIYGGIGLFSKAPSLRKLLKEQKLDKKDVLYIGDELRDVQAAQAVGIRSIAVTWGFAQPSSLEKLQPTALAKTPSALLRILEEL
jgi:phosphoglycolate phosphatase